MIEKVNQEIAPTSPRSGSLGTGCGGTVKGGAGRLLAMMGSSRRPFAVTCLIGLVLTFTGLQAIKLWAAITSWDTLNSLPISVPSTYLTVSAMVWLVVGIFLIFGLWAARSWSPRTTRLTTFFFAIAYWLDRLILQEKGPQSSNLPFDLILSLVLLSSVIAILALPKVRAYFGEGND